MNEIDLLIGIYAEIRDKVLSYIFEHIDMDLLTKILEKLNE